MVEKTLGPKKMAETSQPDLRKLCRKWAEEHIDIQREGFKRLGVNADWEHPYLPSFLTMKLAMLKSLKPCI